METTRDNQRVGLVPAAGLATRLGIATPKELLLFRGKAIINYSVEDLVEAGVDSIVVVIRSGKESIREHLNQAFPSQDFAFVFQSGPIGDLLDAIRASYPSISGKEVLFRMADTYLDPNPFTSQALRPGDEVAIHCFEAPGNEWRHFGVIDEATGRIRDKPSEFVSRVCWGALTWDRRFSERLAAATELPTAINAAPSSYEVNIESFIDIGFRSDANEPEAQPRK